jgi:hypothetical protein
LKTDIETVKVTKPGVPLLEGRVFTVLQVAAVVEGNIEWGLLANLLNIHQVFIFQFWTNNDFQNFRCEFFGKEH